MAKCRSMYEILISSNFNNMWMMVVMKTVLMTNPVFFQRRTVIVPILSSGQFWKRPCRTCTSARSTAIWEG